MLVSKDEFINGLKEKSQLKGKEIKIAHHSSKKHIIGTVLDQDKYSITIQPENTIQALRLYYGSYHILERY